MISAASSKGLTPGKRHTAKPMLEPAERSASALPVPPSKNPSSQRESRPSRPAISSLVSQDWIREAWMAVGGGKIVDIRFVDIHRVGAYLGKCLTKEVFSGIKKARRVTSSRDISLFVKREKEGEWELRPVPIEALYLMWEKLSEDVSLSRDGVLLSFEIGVT